ncbi:MAG TPA: hypothetical protein VK588_11005 [Chitinophagaceae bacterium]|nr:hypothetical protein [Chitinophagaceae bacterium]
MKKILMIVALALTVSTSFAFTGEETVNKRALSAFKTDFSGASDIAWTTGVNYYKVTFTMSDQKLFAFYNGQGEFLAVTRFISSFQLPLNLQNGLKKCYSNFWISDLFEMASNDETSYYVTLENADTKIVLKSTDGKEWSAFLKNKKA